MGDSRFARCLQGGGVYVGDGTVSIVNSQIYSNTAQYVRAHLHKFPSPRWENRGRACLDSRLYRSMFAGRRYLHQFRHGHDNVFLDLWEYSCPCSCSKDPIVTMGDHISLVVCGRLTFCSLFAGRWCLRLWRHSVNRELPDLLQHS
jgi:hypothetical protein